MGVKFAGMILEGSREADFRLSMRLVAAILVSVLYSSKVRIVSEAFDQRSRDVQVLLMFGSVYGVLKAQC